jgi:peptidoglycan/LPS O-acetylase OafA/YrhL
MYGIFAAAAAAGLWRVLPFGTLTAAGCFAAAWSLEKAGVLASHSLAFGLVESRHVAMFGAFFFAGAAWHDFGVSVRPGLSIAALLVGACVLANGTPAAPIVATLAAPCLVLGFGLDRWPVAHGAGRHGDWSYGIYIYGWPVHQTLVAVSAGRLGWAAQIGLVTLVTAILAGLSWWLLERRAVALKPMPGRPRSTLAGVDPAVP